MDFLAKLKVLSAKPANDSLNIMHIPKQGCSKNFLREIQKTYNWADPLYLTFLEFYDGVELDDFHFLGDQGNISQNVIKLAEELMNEEAGFKYLPIAQDSAGDLFYMKEDGKIYWILMDNFYSESYEECVSPSFSDFLNDVCLGRRYIEKFGKNNWYNFLAEQGWA